MMNCHHVQNMISAFIDRELTPEEKREFRQHLFSCRECNGEYEQILELKNCLENLAQESVAFDPLKDLHIRLAQEERLFFQPVAKVYWFGRIGIVTTCLVIFFLSTILLFPKEHSFSASLAKDNSNLSINPVSSDQSFSIDQPVNVYQASFVLP